MLTGSWLTEKVFQKIWDNSIKIQHFSKSIISLSRPLPPTPQTHTQTEGKKERRRRRKKKERKDIVTHTVCQHTHSFYAGTSNRKLTVLCDTMECSEVRAGEAEFNPTTMPPFVFIFSTFVSTGTYIIAHIIMERYWSTVFIFTHKTWFIKQIVPSIRIL